MTTLAHLRPAPDRVAQLEAENEVLRDRLAWFEEEVFGDALQFPADWLLTKTERRLLGILLSMNVVSSEAALAALYRGSLNEPDVKMIDVFVCKLRRKLRPHGIEIATVVGRRLRHRSTASVGTAARAAPHPAAMAPPAQPSRRRGARTMTVRTCRRCGCTDEDCRGCIDRTGAPCSWVAEDLCSACHDLVLPDEMTPAIAEVLGIMCFTSGTLAEIYRAAGYDIKRKIDAEQAFILWRFLPMAILHGEAWREHSSRDLLAQLATIEAKEASEA